MCNQTVCLVAAEMEKRGIATVVVQLLREVAEKVRPPRALYVPFPHGFPLGEPDQAELQTSVVEAALKLLERSDVSPPLLETFEATS